MNICKAAGIRSCRRIALSLCLLLLSAATFAQTTISTGSIQGTVSDPTGALVSGARVTIRNRGTGQTSEITTNSSGAYASGALTPGNYVVQVEATGFNTVQKLPCR